MTHIIAGAFGRRKLKTPKGDKTRPTTSQVRAAVFNILQNEIEGASFLDICAGSGAMGLEALSRGASFASFIEQDRFAQACLRENIHAFGLEKATKIYAGDALLILKRLKEKFTISYFDPPYSRKDSKNFFVESVLQLLDQSDILCRGGALFLEESAYFMVETLSLQYLALESTRQFGNTFLYTFRKK